MNRSINGVSWYLCVTVLSYFLFPLVLEYMEKRYTVKKAIKWIAISILMMVLAGFVGEWIQYSFNHISNYNSIWTNDLTSWFVYKFPLVRIWDIVVGWNLGYIFLHLDNNFNKTTITFMEVVSIILIVLGFEVCYFYSKPYLDNMGLVYTEMWWRFSLIWIISTILLIFSFAIEKGDISRMLVNQMTKYLSSISSYGFLIHYVVLRYLKAIIYHLLHIFNSTTSMTFNEWLIMLILGLISTLLGCEIWLKLEKVMIDYSKKLNNIFKIH